MSKKIQKETGRILRIMIESGWIVFGQIVAVIGSLILVKVLTERLTPTQYGELALGLTVAGLVNQVVMGGISSGMSRFYSVAVEKNELNIFLHDSKKLFACSLFLVMLIGLLLVVALQIFGFSNWTGITIAVVLFSILDGLNNCLSGIQNAARQRSIVAFNRGMDSWLKIIFSLIAMTYFGASGTSVVIGYCCSSILVNGSQLFFLRKTIPEEPISFTSQYPFFREIMVYAWPFATWGLFGWAQQSAGRWGLESFSSTADVGLYSALLQLGYAPIQLITSFTLTLLMPILFAHVGDANDKYRNADLWKRVLMLAKYGVAIVIFAFILALILHKYVFLIFLQESYLSVSYCLPWMILSGGIFAIAQILASIPMALKVPKELIVASIGSSILGVIISFIGAYLFSVAGVVGASLIHSLSYLVFVLLKLNKIKKGK